MWKVQNGRLVRRDMFEFDAAKSGFTKNKNAIVQQDTATAGEKCLYNVIKTIRAFKPKAWYIENPKSSYMWKYISLNTDFQGFMNVANYGSYGFPTKKPTVFYSNVRMNLKENRCEQLSVAKSRFNGRLWNISMKTKNAKNEAGDRSAIPPDLVRQIFIYFDKAIELGLTDGTLLDEDLYQPKLF